MKCQTQNEERKERKRSIHRLMDGALARRITNGVNHPTWRFSWHKSYPLSPNVSRFNAQLFQLAMESCGIPRKKERAFDLRLCSRSRRRCAPGDQASSFSRCGTSVARHQHHCLRFSFSVSNKTTFTCATCHAHQEAPRIRNSWRLSVSIREKRICRYAKRLSALHCAGVSFAERHPHRRAFRCDQLTLEFLDSDLYLPRGSAIIECRPYAPRKAL